MWAGGVDTLHVSQLSLGTDDSLYDSWMRRVPLLNGLYHCGRPIAAIQQTGGGLLDGKGHLTPLLGLRNGVASGAH